jgi:glycosyltransferase involved in cell wall biosynthesis
VQTPDISFVITNLNGARKLERTLPRLLEVVGASTFRERYELVVVDAGSRDDSLEVLDRFRRENGNTVVRSEPCTRGRGRELAFELTRGQHVAVLDSDTYVRPYYGSFLQGYLAAATKDPGTILAYEDMDGRRANLTCTVHPREALVRVGGWKDLNCGEDIDLWARLARDDRLRFLPACLGDDLDHVLAPTAPTSGDYRTIRERRYARGIAFYRRWIDQTYGRYVGYAYSYPEKIRYDWARQPRWSNRLQDLIGSAIARLRYYEGHPPVVRLDPSYHNGYALTRHLLDHIVLPSEFGLDDGIMEIRTNRIVREFVASGALSPRALEVYAELTGRGRVVDSGD